MAGVQVVTFISQLEDARCVFGTCTLLALFQFSFELESFEGLQLLLSELLRIQATRAHWLSLLTLFV